MKLNNMELIELPVEMVKPNPKNPRIDLKPGMPLYEKLKKSIENFGYADPIIWNDKTGMIVSGHQRFQVMKDIAQKEGKELTTVQVVKVSMDESKQDGFMIAVNKITGLWDEEKLSAILRELDEEDRLNTGFDDYEIATLLDDNSIQDFTFDEDNEEESHIHKASGYAVTIVCNNDIEQEWLRNLLQVDELKHRFKAEDIFF